jgi:CHAT domain-containing protein/Tfp pilus assembly protein PilF
MRIIRGRCLCVVVFVLALTSAITAQEESRVPQVAGDDARLRGLAEQVAAAKTDDERAALLAAEKTLVTAALSRALVAHGNELRAQGKAVQALAAYQSALDVAARLGDKSATAYALRFLGNFHFQGNPRLGLESYQKSLKLYEELGDRAGIAQMNYNVGEAHSALGDLAAALESYRKCQALREALNDQAGRAVSLERVGIIHLRQGSHSQAQESFRQALALSAANHTPRGKATLLVRLGDVERFQRNQEQALDYYRRALALHESLNDRAGAAQTLMNMGYSYDAQHDFARAAEHYQKSLAAFEALGNKGGMAQAYRMLGNIFHAQHNYAIALEYLQKSLVLHESVGNKLGAAGALDVICAAHGMQGNTQVALENCRKSLAIREALGNRLATAYTLTMIAWTYHHAGDHRQALDYYRRALQLREAAGDRAGAAEILHDAGEAHEKLGDLAQARDYFEKSLKLHEAAGNKEWAARALYNLGRLHVKQGHPAQALELAGRAAELARESNGYEALWRAQLLAGLAHRALNRPTDAQQAFAASVTTIETMRSQLAGSEHERIRYLEARLAPWHRLVESLAAQNKVGEALGYAEQAKARGLLDVMHNGHAVFSQAMTAPEQERERKINAELASLNARIFQAAQRPTPDEALLTELRASQQRTRAEREAFYSSLYATHRELRALRGKAQPLKMEEADQLLPDAATALLNYLVTDERTILFVLTRAGRGGRVAAQSYTIEVKAADLAERARAFRLLLAGRGYDFQAAARELYDLLLRPAAAQLRGKRMLVISPDAQLWELPFQALQSAPRRYLIEEHAVTYVPSLSVLRETMRLRSRRPRDTPASQMLLAMGNPALGGETVARARPALMGEKLEPLPEAEKQIKGLKQLYDPTKSRFLTGAEAGEATFKAEAEKYRILHLATHGVLNDASGIYSYLLLAQSGAGGGAGGEDGLLEAWELIRMNLRADLVVLSACETARGRWAAGEGLIGMAGMLFVAGCPTVVVSQWKVESASTTELMVEFHRQLNRGRRPSAAGLGAARALRAAALKLLGGGQYRHPFWWAGFVVVGNGN